MPRGVIRSAPVSDTGGPGAKPGEAANHRRSTKSKHLTSRNAEAVSEHFMTDILNKTIVLVLNRNWQAINIRTPQDAFCKMATNVATGLDIAGENHIRPVTWEEWITLPIREGREPAQGRPPAARGRPQAAHRPARAEGTAGDGAHPQRPRRGRVETVPEGMRKRGGWSRVTPPAFSTRRIRRGHP